MSPGHPSPMAPMARKKLRVATGCLTCRRRHVKCDERKPTCANCGKKARTCRYPDFDPPVKRRASTRTAQITQTPPTDSQGGLDWDLSLNEPETLCNDFRSSSNGAGSTSAAAFIDDTVVSPFLVTLESILLDADYAHAGSSALQAQPSVETPAREDHASPGSLHVDYRIQLSGTDIPVFRNYIETVSSWIDSFSHDQPFRRQVPTLALRCPSLLNACLALSAKQLDLVGLGSSIGLAEGDTTRYYRLALSAIRGLLLKPESAHSDEVLAACIILSTYEMIDVVGDSLGSHMAGVASLLQTRQVYGNVSGIRGACYWVCLRHGMWCSLRTGRQLSLDASYWQPPALESFDYLSPEDIANRAIFLLAQSINFCNDTEARSRAGADEWLRICDERGSVLEQALDEWKSKLPPSMKCYDMDDTMASQMGALGSMSFLSPQSAVANQVYHASKVLLLLHRTNNGPIAQGLLNCTFISLRKQIERHRKEIFLTANSLIPDAWSFVSSQCLYIAGLVTEDALERQRTVELIEQCQRDTGRKTGVLCHDLRRVWEAEGSNFVTPQLA